jgi:GT2 family glycosyltransferase
MAEKISFVVLTWNSDETIRMCIDGIVGNCGSEGLDYEIIIVDNGSSDGTVGTIESYNGVPISLIQLNENKGTTYTRNLAIKKSSGNVICIIDSDASFIEGRIGDICSALRNDPSIGIIAPQLIESSGSIQTSVRKFPSVLGKISRIPKIIFKMKMKEFDSYKDFPFTEKTEVDCAISACWFLRSDLFEQIGLLDERIFYSPEDVDYCLRARKHGKKIVYFPEFKVLHKTQQITHNKVISKIAFSHLYGLVYYFFKHKYVRNPGIK